MGPDRVATDTEDFGDLLVSSALTQQRKDLDFSSGQLALRPGLRLSTREPGDRGINEDIPRQPDLTLEYGPDPFEEQVEGFVGVEEPPYTDGNRRGFTSRAWRQIVERHGDGRLSIWHIRGHYASDLAQADVRGIHKDQRSPGLGALPMRLARLGLGKEAARHSGDLTQTVGTQLIQEVLTPDNEHLAFHVVRPQGGLWRVFPCHGSCHCLYLTGLFTSTGREEVVRPAVLSFAPASDKLEASSDVLPIVR
jgi:hypothetical protein